MTILSEYWAFNLVRKQCFYLQLQHSSQLKTLYTALQLYGRRGHDGWSVFLAFRYGYNA